MEKYTGVLLLMILYCSAMNICCNCSDMSCLPEERLVLLRFNNELGGLLPLWKGLSCCEWDGVECSNLTSHVTQLHLSNLLPQNSSSSTDTLTPLFELKHLEHLDLSSNGFSGVVPPGFSALQNLRYLDISDNQFEGEIPLQLGNLSRLQYLNIAMSKKEPFKCRSSLEWARNLPSLQYLSVKFVEVTSTGEVWGEYISHLRNLQFLDMSNCKLSGPISTALLNLTSLTNLDFHGNNFSCAIQPWVGNMTSLISLSFYNSNISGPFPQSLSSLPHLEELRMSENDLLIGDLNQILGSGWPSLTLFYLSGPNIRGTIPHSIGNISSLTILKVVETKVEGPIPGSVGNLPLLDGLILRDNSLTGGIPPSLGQLSRLTILHLANNHLSGNIPPQLGGLTSLLNLHLQSNKLNGTIPASLGGLPLIKVIDLSFNSLEGRFSLQVFKNSSSLVRLYLSYNQLTVSLSPDWIPQTYFEVLDMASCNIGGFVPIFLSTQYKLLALGLSNNSFVGSIPTWLWDLDIKNYLNLSYNNLEGQIPPSLDTRLLTLDLQSNMLSGSLPMPSKTSSRSLQVLNLSHNNFTGIIPIQIGKLLPKIVALGLSNNKLSGQIPPSITNCSVLAKLNLADTGLEGEIPSTMGRLYQLQTLHLNDNKLTGKLPLSLSNCSVLEILDIGNNLFSGKIPPWLSRLSQLMILVLRNNTFKGNIPTELGNLSHLHVLDLSHNKLIGPIPPELKKLAAGMVQVRNSTKQTNKTIPSYYKEEIVVTNKESRLVYVNSILLLITCIDLSGNQLSGTIPPTIGALNGLRILNISRNNITGEIPHTLGMLENIESLDLSYNNLQGKIPMEMQGLYFLAVFIVSNNKLCGKIPAGAQFSTFNAAYFNGNPCLCGIPTDIKCPGSPGIIPTRDDEEEEEEEGTEDPWYWYVGLMASFGAGFWGVFAVLYARKTWRYTFIRHLDEIVISFSDSLAVHWKAFKRKIKSSHLNNCSAS